MERLKSILKGDRHIWVVVLVLAVVGAVEVYSCTAMIAYKFQGGDTFYYPLRHLFYLVIGISMMCFFSWMPYKKLVKYADWLQWGFVFLLFVTLVMGHATNDAKRWITIPIIGMSFQTSDFARCLHSPKWSLKSGGRVFTSAFSQ